MTARLLPLLLLLLLTRPLGAQEANTPIAITAPGVSKAEVFRGENDQWRVRLTEHGGHELELDGPAFIGYLHERYRERSFTEKIFNVSGPGQIAWVVLGFAAQFMFTGRMIVQWLASERAGRSTVPSVFWWMSLTGGLMLLVYFVWRKDAVGVFGQSTGVFIYLRNLVLIRKHHVNGGAERGA